MWFQYLILNISNLEMQLRLNMIALVKVTFSDFSYVEAAPQFRTPGWHAGTLQVRVRPSSR